MSQRILDTGNGIANERPQGRFPRNHFDFSHDFKCSGTLGALIPIMMQEIFPGDRVKIKMECLLRLQPMLAPVMHRMGLRAEAFFVPNRQLWENWENFISPQHPGDVAPAFPIFSSCPMDVQTVADYIGLPLNYVDPENPASGYQPVDNVSALPFAAYQKVTTDWYRDEDLDPNNDWSPLMDGDNGDITAWNTLQFRNQDRDYFTSCKPWPQKGDAVAIPLSAVGAADVKVYTDNTAGHPQAVFKTVTGAIINDVPGTGHVNMDFNHPVGADGSAAGVNASDGTSGLQQMYFDAEQSGLMAKTKHLELSGAGTIEELREAEALQKFLEADSRGGTRYTEMLKQHWDEMSDDMRLQRAQYLGSVFQPVAVSEVLNTTGTAEAPQGTMTGHGISVAHNHGNEIDESFNEYGWLVIICSVIPTTAYMQGKPKMFDRRDRLDYPFPEFAELGEEPVYNRELYYDSTDIAGNNAVFGYLPRYTNERMAYNRVAGDFKNNLDFWHLGLKFAVRPVLNELFLKAYAEKYARIFAVEDTYDHLLFHWYFDFQMLRKLPRLVRPTV